MKARQQTQSPKPRRPFRGLTISLIVFAFLTLGGMGAVSLWFAHRLHQFDQLRTDIGADYARLNQAHPFDPPAPEAAPRTEPATRMEAYLRVHEALTAALESPLDARASALLGRDRIRESQLIWVLQKSYDDFENAARAHVAALRRESMSPAEYRWIHGLVMRDALDAPGEPAVAIYAETLSRLERLAAASRDGRVSGLTAESYLQGLRERYAAYPRADAAFWARFGRPGPAAALVDLAAAYYEPSDLPQGRDISEIRPIE